MPLLTLRERPRVNHVHRSVRVQDENDLKEPASAAPDQPLFVRPPKGKRRPSSGDDALRFLRVHPVLSRVLEVPSVSAEVHVQYLWIKMPRASTSLECFLGCAEGQGSHGE